ncbi:prepilin-type N-terminal cleavage/methylation domain-containing protein [Rickettsiales bacterium]|nr:prepilin-type N-terminal cleavage/methylation domain-containing protein [Rickettsiales bacterium]
MKKESGFTLVELSIVIVIIGLIVAGIFAGQDLIKQARVKSVIDESNKYKMAWNTFKLKYNAFPGDMDNASSYWGAATNGNGDRYVAVATESYYAWHHLALSNMINGVYTGAPDSNNCTFGVNCPGSARGAGGYVYWGDSTNGNRLRYAKPTSNSGLTTATINPQDAKSIDDKLDDGVPDAGNVLSATGAAATGTCLTGSVYTLTNEADACYIDFVATK